jgi:3-hydroxyacyl-[acyl-carrier-protein] dehydratase
MSDEQPLKKPVDVETITRLIPHRYPFLLVDRVIDYELGQWIKAIKNVTFNEPHFTGHFPKHPVMPGVLILEALAQASGILSQLETDMADSEEAVFYLVKIDKARFNQIVVPGDQLELNATLKRTLRNMALYQCEAKVDGKIVAKAEMLCARKQ